MSDSKPSAIFITIGGAYGDEYRTALELSPDHWRAWQCGEAVIIKVDANLVAYEPTGIGEFTPIQPPPNPEAA